MSSLKSFLPSLGEILGISPAALYTRQRALVDMSVLTYLDGRGPGSGSTLSGENLAAMIISIMTADTLQETDRRVRDMCRAIPKGPTIACPWTGEPTLQRALGSLFDKDEALKSFANFSIYRGTGALIQYGRPNSALESAFSLKGRSTSSAIRISARLDATSFRQLFATYRAATL